MSWVAPALAEAYLAGEALAPAVVDRWALVLGERPPWLGRLARTLLKIDPPPGEDDVEQLAERIRLFLARRARSVGPSDFQVRRFLFAEPTMGKARFEVPPLATVADVAALLDLEVGVLLAFADVEGRARRATRDAIRHYTFTWRARPGAAPRLLEAPRPKLKAAQRLLLRAILDRVPVHPAAHGFVRGRSIVTLAREHAGKEAVLRLDLESFFPSITGARVTAIFQALGYRRTIARILAGLVTTRARVDVLAAAPRPDLATAIAARHRALRRYAERHLPQGAPTSPAIANLAAFGLDVRLDALARSHGAAYGRYADDLVFSGDASLARSASGLIALVAQIAAEEGFSLQARKTRLMRRGARQLVAGVVVNDVPGVARRDRERLEAILHGAATRGPAGENRDHHPDFRAHLRGRIAHVAAVNPAHAKKLLALFEAIDWSG